MYTQKRNYSEWSLRSNVGPSGVSPSGSLSASGVQEYKYDVKLSVFDKQMKTKWEETGQAKAASENEAALVAIWGLSNFWEPRYYKISVLKVKKVEENNE